MKSHAQSDIIAVEPKPYQLSPYYDQLVTTTISKITVLTTKDEQLASNPNSFDTSFIYYYDRNGRKEKQIRFDKGKRTYVYYYTYEGKKIASWSEIYQDKKDTYTWQYVKNKFDKNGNKILSEGVNIYRKDTSRGATIVYEYDNTIPAKLIKKSISNNGVPTSVEEYQYETTKLVAYSFKMASATAPAITKYVYGEDDGLLAAVHDPNNNAHFFIHKNGMLDNEQYINRFPEQFGLYGFTQVRYSYNTNKTLAAMDVVMDSLYKNVKYTYQSGKIKNITVKSNAWNYLNREFFIPLSNFIDKHTPVPFLYEEQYAYDNKGNIIEKKLLLNGEVKRVVKFVVEYF